MVLSLIPLLKLYMSTDSTHVHGALTVMHTLEFCIWAHIGGGHVTTNPCNSLPTPIFSSMATFTASQVPNLPVFLLQLIAGPVTSGLWSVDCALILQCTLCLLPVSRTGEFLSSLTPPIFLLGGLVNLQEGLYQSTTSGATQRPSI